MKPKAFAILAVVALAIGVLGYVASTKRATTASTPAGPGRAGPNADTPSDPRPLWLPELSKDPAKIAGVAIQRGSKVIEFSRAANAGSPWTLPAKGNYPALDDKVLALVRGILDARAVETKTANPELFDRLGLVDPTRTEPEKKPVQELSTLVTLRDASGGELAKLVLGKKHEAANYDQNKAGTFVREAHKNQSYLVQSTFTIAMEEVDWFKRSVMEFDPGRFSKALIQHPSKPDGTTGEAVHIDRAPGAPAAVLAELPQGRTLSDELAASRVLEALASLTIDDVAKVESVDFDSVHDTKDPAKAGTPIDGTWSTSDGVTFTVRSVLKEGKPWTRVRASFSPPAINTPVASPEEAKKAADELKVRQDEIAKEVAVLDAKLAPWAFMVNESTGKSLRATADSLLTPAGEPAQPGPNTGLPSTDPGAMPFIVPQGK